MYSVPGGLDSGIPLSNRGADPWDARASLDDVAGNAARAEQEPLSRGGHMRSDSMGSVSTILGEKQQEPQSYIGGALPQRQPTYASARQGSVDQPMNAYTQAPQPTPYGYGNNYYGGPGYAGVDQPGRAQPHPGTSP